MKKTLTWLHISDIHFNKTTKWRDDAAMGSLIAYLKNCFKTNDSLRPDFIFCTGDIAFGETSRSKLTDQYAYARKFFDDLLAVCSRKDSLLPKERLFVVPGNHDTNRHAFTKANQDELIRKAKLSNDFSNEINQCFEELKSELDLNRLQAYADFIKDYLPHQDDTNGRHCYANIVDINGLHVGIGGFNSAWSCAGPEDDRHLWMAADWQFNFTSKKLEEADVRIGLIHHPIDWLNLADRDIAMRRITRMFSFWLHGHSHNAWVLPTQHFVEIAAGAVCAKESDEFGINLVQIDIAKAKGKVHLHSYSARDGRWSPTHYDDLAPDGQWLLTNLPLTKDVPSFKKLHTDSAFDNSHGVKDFEKITVVLAANSPLYAPIFLAKYQEVNDTCKNMEIEIADSSYIQSHNGDIKDLFINAILRRYKSNTKALQENLMVGIGDPMRITAVPKSTKDSDFYEPYIVGSLINKMCFWLLDHKRPTEDTKIKWEDHFKALLVHPAVMTGHSVPIYFYCKANNLDLKQGIGNILFYPVSPGNEHIWYDKLKKSDIFDGVKSEHDFAFITTDFMQAHESRTEHGVHINFLDFAAQETLDDAVMTGIIVGREIYKNESNKKLINNLKDGIKWAIQSILFQPQLSAYFCYNSYKAKGLNLVQRTYKNDKPHTNAVVPFFALWNASDLAKYFTICQANKTYNPTLIINKTQWRKATEIKQYVKDLISKDEYIREADKLDYHYYCNDPSIEKDEYEQEQDLFTDRLEKAKKQKEPFYTDIAKLIQELDKDSAKFPKKPNRLPNLVLIKAIQDIKDWNSIRSSEIEEKFSFYRKLNKC